VDAARRKEADHHRCSWHWVGEAGTNGKDEAGAGAKGTEEMNLEVVDGRCGDSKGGAEGAGPSMGPLIAVAVPVAMGGRSLLATAENVRESGMRVVLIKVWAKTGMDAVLAAAFDIAVRIIVVLASGCWTFVLCWLLVVGCSWLVACGWLLNLFVGVDGKAVSLLDGWIRGCNSCVGGTAERGCGTSLFPVSARLGFDSSLRRRRRRRGQTARHGTRSDRLIESGLTEWTSWPNGGG